MGSLKHISQHLIQWYHRNKRALPWRATNDPYVIWLSEIILQQTRVQQGLPYFKKFVNRYPSVEDLAAASEDEILKMWEGLGYYNRARNLLTAARQVVHEFGGTFPNNYKDLKKLKGVGPYTAAAIASFAFKLPHAVVDGNVFRVLSRLFAISTPIDTTAGKKEFSQLAQKLLDKEQPDTHNQAIMEFGAKLCTSRNPACLLCPLQEECQALQAGKVHNYPVKSKKQKKKKRYFNYLVLRTPSNYYYIQKRGENDIWRNLYEFPLIETNHIPELTELKKTDEWQQLFPQKGYSLQQTSDIQKQTLSHQHIYAVFWHYQIEEARFSTNNLLKIKQEELPDYAFPKIIVCYLEEKILPLHLK